MRSGKGAGGSAAVVIDIHSGEVLAAASYPTFSASSYLEDYEDYRSAMGTLGWDIALAPLPDTPFHRCKHYNKYIEYASYGQKSRVTYSYDDKTGKVLEEVEYNDRNRPVRIRKYEWNANGTKAKQYNYLPNGKLFSVKVFEYIFSDK